MESDNFKAGGQMDQHTLLNAPYNQGRVMCTTSQLLAKEAHYGGMLIFPG